MLGLKELIHDVLNSLNIGIAVVLIIIIRIIAMHICSYMGCHEISASNVLHLNLICNGCNNIIYEFQRYHLDIYFAIGKMLIQNVEKYIQSIKINLNP